MKNGLTLLAVGVASWGWVTASGQAVPPDPPDAGIERPRADAGARAIFAKAKAAEERGAVNFFGFYPGMQNVDAFALAAHYGLEAGEWDCSAHFFTREVYEMRFTLQDVRRIADAANSFDELVQAVASQVGAMHLKRKGAGDDSGAGWYEHRNLDGTVLTLSQVEGCCIRDVPLEAKAKKALRDRSARRMKREDKMAMEAAAVNERLRVGGAFSPGEVRTMTLPGGAEMEFVWCPPGCFLLGSPVGEEGRRENEMFYQVSLTKGFWLAKTEVTQRQWTGVMGSNPSQFRGDDLPVEGVTWKDCVKFCQRTGLRLPTEAQWEYACRADAKGAYAGTGRLDDMGWYVDNSGGTTHPVGGKRPNAWGAHDMHGNVWEWCSDWYGLEVPRGGMADNPTGPKSGPGRLNRGGSWGSSAAYCRSAVRDYDHPSYSGEGLGFRPVLVQGEAEEDEDRQSPVWKWIRPFSLDLGLSLRNLWALGRILTNEGTVLWGEGEWKKDETARWFEPGGE